METAKRILTKKKIDKQLAGKSTSTPFMSFKDSTGCNQKAVSFDNHNILNTKLYKLTAMMTKLTTEINNKNQAQDPSRKMERSKQKKKLLRNR